MFHDIYSTEGEYPQTSTVVNTAFEPGSLSPPGGRDLHEEVKYLSRPPEAAMATTTFALPVGTICVDVLAHRLISVALIRDMSSHACRRATTSTRGSLVLSPPRDCSTSQTSCDDPWTGPIFTSLDGMTTATD
jgi:hypothetical protein